MGHNLLASWNRQRPVEHHGTKNNTITMKNRTNDDFAAILPADSPVKPDMNKATRNRATSIINDRIIRTKYTSNSPLGIYGHLM